MIVISKLMSKQFTNIDYVRVGRIAGKTYTGPLETMLYEVLYCSFDQNLLGKISGDYVRDIKKMIPGKY